NIARVTMPKNSDPAGLFAHPGVNALLQKNPALLQPPPLDAGTIRDVTGRGLEAFADGPNPGRDYGYREGDLFHIVNPDTGPVLSTWQQTLAGWQQKVRLLGGADPGGAGPGGAPDPAWAWTRVPVDVGTIWRGDGDAALRHAKRGGWARARRDRLLRFARTVGGGQGRGAAGGVVDEGR